MSGQVEVEVNEGMWVSAMRILGQDSTKVEYAKGKQCCQQQAECLKNEDVLQLSEQPTGNVGHLEAWQQIRVTLFIRAPSARAAAVLLQGEVWLCPLFCKGPDGEATPANPRAQETL